MTSCNLCCANSIPGQSTLREVKSPTTHASMRCSHHGNRDRPAPSSVRRDARTLVPISVVNSPTRHMDGDLACCPTLISPGRGSRCRSTGLCRCSPIRRNRSARPSDKRRVPPHTHAAERADLDAGSCRTLGLPGRADLSRSILKVRSSNSSAGVPDQNSESWSGGVLAGSSSNNSATSVIGVAPRLTSAALPSFAPGPAQTATCA